MFTIVFLGELRTRFISVLGSVYKEFETFIFDENLLKAKHVFSSVAFLCQKKMDFKDVEHEKRKGKNKDPIY